MTKYVPIVAWTVLAAPPLPPYQPLCHASARDLPVSPEVGGIAPTCAKLRRTGARNRAQVRKAGRASARAHATATHPSTAP